MDTEKLENLSLLIKDLAKKDCNLPKFARAQNYYFNYPSWITPSPSLL